MMMKKQLSSTFLIFQGYLISLAFGRNYHMFSGMDSLGSDISYWTGPHNDCQMQCDNTANCIGYTLDRQAGANCWLKSKVGPYAPNVQRDTYFVPKRTYALQNGGNSDFLGNDIQYWEGPFSECGNQCDSTQNCTGYVLHNDNNVNCWLKSAMENNVPDTRRNGYLALPRQYSLSKGIDHGQNDISYFVGPYSECPNECDKTVNCVAYVLHVDRGENCWLKSTLGAATPNIRRDTFIYTSP